MKLNCKRIDFTYTPGEEIFAFSDESGLPFIFDVEEELTGDPAAMDAVGKMLDEAELLAEKAKAAIKAALADEDSRYHGVVTFFMEFYRDDVDPDIAAELFPGTDPAKLSFAEMVDFLRLDRFGSLVDYKMDQQVFIMDLSFNPEITDELMVIYFDLNQEIFCITNERELPMEKATAVNTCLGVLKGRDCIYLDQVKQDALNNLTFTGDINGHLVSQHRDEKDWFPYILTFRQVLACFTCELDTYENLVGTEYLDGSSFDLIEDSTWLKSLPVREDFDKGIYRHYRLFTYDDVYNIIAVSYEFAAEL